jgi:hypothetical protein
MHSRPASSLPSRIKTHITTLLLALPACSDTATTSPTGDVVQSEQLAAQRSVVRLKLHTPATLRADGTVTVTVRALCPSDFRVVEGPLTLMQGPEFQEIFGEGFFTNQCDGRWHTQQVRVFAPEGFSAGTARASASLMVEHPETGEFLQGDDRGTVRIR